MTVETACLQAILIVDGTDEKQHRVLVQDVAETPCVTLMRWNWPGATVHEGRVAAPKGAGALTLTMAKAIRIIHGADADPSVDAATLAEEHECSTEQARAVLRGAGLERQDQ